MTRSPPLHVQRSLVTTSATSPWSGIRLTSPQLGTVTKGSQTDVVFINSLSSPGGCCSLKAGSNICPINEPDHVSNEVYDQYRAKCNTDNCNTMDPRWDSAIPWRSPRRLCTGLRAGAGGTTRGESSSMAGTMEHQHWGHLCFFHLLHLCSFCWISLDSRIAWFILLFICQFEYRSTNQQFNSENIYPRKGISKFPNACKKRIFWRIPLFCLLSTAILSSASILWSQLYKHCISSSHLTVQSQYQKTLHHVFGQQIPALAKNKTRIQFASKRVISH